MKLILLFFFVLAHSLAHSQSLHVFSVSTENYPNMSAKFLTFDQFGRKVQPTQGTFSIIENGTANSSVTFTCPVNTQKKSASILFVIDISASMSSNFYNGKAIDKVQNAIKNVLITLPQNTFECAITAFNDKAYLVQDYTTDIATLEQSLLTLLPFGGTSVGNALLMPPSGAVQITKRAKYPSTIIFLTDGFSEISDTIFDPLLGELLQQKATLHTISYGIDASESLKTLVDTTNGTFQEFILTENDISSILMDIFSSSFGESPCIANWTTPLECTLGRKNATFEWSGKSITKEYKTTKTVEVPFNFTPDELTFGFKGLGVESDTILRLTAKDLPVTVSNLVCTNPLFTVSPTSFSLQPGESVDLNISYSTPDSFYAFTELRFDTPCPSKFIVRGGFRHLINPNGKIRLLSPNGGDIYRAGSEYVIRWDRVAPTDTVTLHYSTNSGNTWHFITDEASNNEYLWKTPKISTDNCIVRVWLNDPFKKRRRTDSNDIYMILPTTNGEMSTWSKDGSRIYYGASRPLKNQDLYVIDVEKKRLIDTLRLPLWSSHVRTVHRNPQSELLAIGDSNLIIYDPIAKIEVRRFLTPKQWHIVQDVKWSPDGTKLAAVYISQFSLFSNIFVLYDVASGQRLESIEYTDSRRGRTQAVAWSKDGKKIAFSGFGAEVSIYDVTTKNIDPLIQLTTGLNRKDLDWSLDGERVATASGIRGEVFVDDKNILYNTTSGIEEAAVSMSHFSLLSVYHPKEEFIVFDSIANIIAYEDKTLRRFHRFSTPYPKHTFTDGFTSLDFSPLGDQLMGTINFVSNFRQNSLIVWEIHDTLMPRDISDSVFSIVQPELQTASIDMKEVLLQTVKDSVITPFVTNASIFPVGVESIRISGVDSSAFMLLQGVPNYILLPNADATAEIQFAPKKLGVHNAIIIVETDARTITIPLTGIGVRPEVVMNGEFIDFGKIKSGSSKDSFAIPTVISQSQNQIVVDSIFIRGGDVNNFEFISVVPAGTPISTVDKLPVDIRFIATEIRRFQSNLILYHSGIFTPITIPLFGEGTDTATGEVRIVIPQLEARTNSVLSVPVFIEYPQNTIFSTEGEVLFNLVVNGTVLFPRQFYSISRYENEKFNIPVILPLQANAQGLLGTIPLEVNLGNASFSDLQIDSLRVRNSRLRATKRDGYVIILDICEEGGERLLHTSKKVSIALVSAQPANEEATVEMTVAEKGQTTLSIVDLSGNTVATLYKGSPEFEMTQIRFSTSMLANGIYFLSLKTPTVDQIIPLVIQK